MSIQLLQLTDLHLFADPDKRLKGVPTRAAFLDVWQSVRADARAFDLLVITGDLAHDEQLETYEFLRGLLGEWVARCRLIPGNHDSRPLLRQVFPEAVPGGDGPLTFSVSAGNWRLIGLDSHVPGEVAGRIETEQLDWLRNELSVHSDEPTILFVHHPPMSVDSVWLDRIGLQKPAALVELIQSSSQVRVVSAGHVHHEFTGSIGDTVLLTTPSTAIQFCPGDEELVFDWAPPGFRVFRLDGETYETEVVRLPELKYPPEAM